MSRTTNIISILKSLVVNFRSLYLSGLFMDHSNETYAVGAFNIVDRMSGFYWIFCLTS